MIIVTGGAGFIGSNLVRGLNQRGETDILVVDNLTNGQKMHNLADLDIADYIDKDEFINRSVPLVFLITSVLFCTKEPVRQPPNGMVITLWPIIMIILSVCCIGALQVILLCLCVIGFCIWLRPTRLYAG